MQWYRVIKTLRGRKDLYWQKTYRVGKQVKTLNKYIGPLSGLLTGSGSGITYLKRPSGNLESLHSQPTWTCEQCGKDNVYDHRDPRFCVECALNAAPPKQHAIAPRPFGINSPEMIALEEADRDNCPDCAHQRREYGIWRCARHYDPAEDNARSMQQTGMPVYDHTGLANDDAFKVEQVSKLERSEYERMRWGTKKYRVKKAATKLRAAKKRLKGAKRINPFIGKTGPDGLTDFSRSIGLARGRYFCKRCEAQTHQVDFEGLCEQCSRSVDSTYFD